MACRLPICNTPGVPLYVGVGNVRRQGQSLTGSGPRVVHALCYLGGFRVVVKCIRLFWNPDRIQFFEKSVQETSIYRRVCLRDEWFNYLRHPNCFRLCSMRYACILGTSRAFKEANNRKRHVSCAVQPSTYFSFQSRK